MKVSVQFSVVYMVFVWMVLKWKKRNDSQYTAVCSLLLFCSNFFFVQFGMFNWIQTKTTNCHVFVKKNSTNWLLEYSAHKMWAIEWISIKTVTHFSVNGFQWRNKHHHQQQNIQIHTKVREIVSLFSLVLVNFVLCMWTKFGKCFSKIVASKLFVENLLNEREAREEKKMIT